MPIVATHVLLPPPLALLPLLPQPATASAPIAVAAMITLPFMDTPLHFSGYLESSGFKPGWPRNRRVIGINAARPVSRRTATAGDACAIPRRRPRRSALRWPGNDRASRAARELTAEAAGVHIR